MNDAIEGLIVVSALVLKICLVCLIGIPVVGVFAVTLVGTMFYTGKAAMYVLAYIGVGQ